MRAIEKEWSFSIPYRMMGFRSFVVFIHRSNKYNFRNILFQITRVLVIEQYFTVIRVIFNLDGFVII